ncbi:hypothetical protein BASA83_002542 [Batrachochytrium salamandrivorans]|nr:hypothetical protein BASA83_002542 [Batrachochytrium salamandrivorans]
MTACAKDYYVPTLPGLNNSDAEEFKMHAGHLPGVENSTQTFFWLIQSQFNPPKDKLVWILDQPVGTGYSYSTKNERFSKMIDISNNFVSFLENFFNTFPEYRRFDLHIAGESFAGIYIPNFASEILRRNKEHNANFRLKSIIIGNGWMDPIRQYESFLPFSEKHNLLHGTYLQTAQKGWDECKVLLGNKEALKYPECEKILEQILHESRSSGKLCINVYDVRLRDEKANQGCGLSWPTGLDHMIKYLSRDDVKLALHASGVGNKPWVECQRDVHTAIDRGNATPSYIQLPEILSQIQVVLFQGDQDIICNWMGLKAMVDTLQWGNGKGLEGAKQTTWTINGKDAGWFSTSRNLTFVLLYNASHMPSVDAPLASLDMINRVVQINSTQPLFRSALGTSAKPLDDINQPPPGDLPPPPGSYMLALGFLMIVGAIVFFGGMYACHRSKSQAAQNRARRDGSNTGSREWERVPTSEFIELQET